MDLLEPSSAIATGGAALPARRVAPSLTGVSETMLWSLHNRASETKRPDRVLIDPDSLRIHAELDYDFAGHFGEPGGSLAMRAAEIDTVLRRWIEHHPDGCVVSLGEGLETQFRRVDNGRINWLSVDLPDAIALRGYFLPPAGRLRHIAASALDEAWMDAVDPSSGVFIVAQGLLMYLQPAMVRDLIGAIAGRFPTVDMVFDVVPAWFSSLTLQGLWQTPRYRLPAMPWGINRDAIEPTLHSWLNGRLGVVTFLPYSQPRGMPSSLGSLIKQMPVVRHAVPSLVHLSMKAETGGNTVISEPVVFGGASTSSVRATGGPHCPSARRSEMNAIAPNETLSGVMAAATRHAGDHSDLAVAAAGVVAKRVALGLAAAFDPLSANHAEFERMVPEKLEAFSAAGLIMLKTSGEASLQMTRLASDAAVTTATATMAMTRCSTPAALLEAQRLFAVGWFERAASAFAAMGMLTLGVQAAAMSPIRQTVTANAKRLGG